VGVGGIMPEPVQSGQRYMPGLDGLRALAVLAVIAYHLHLGWAPGGMLGVGVFFTLSGYLITDLLLGQHEATGTLQLADFWRRRARRLLPALSVLLAVVTAWVTLLDRPQLSALRGVVLAAVGYVTNWWLIAQHSSYFAQFGPPSPLGHLWSLAVEEQFYLVWPLVVWKLRESKALFYVLISVVIICPIVRMLLVQRGFSPLRLYLWTPFRIDALCWGALAAYCVRNFTARRVELAGAIALFAGIAAVLLIAIKRHGFDEYDGMVAGFGYTSLGLLFSGVLVRLLRMKSWSASFFSVSPLRTLGKYSYGIYVYHWLLAPLFVWTGLICARATGSKGVGILVPLLMAFVVTVPLAMLSYRFYERPWLNLKDRWAPR